MCEFVSWIEKDDAVLFLTANDIFNTKRGRELQKFCQNPDDLVGHGATRFYYNDLKGGRNCECTNFSTPKNFPKEIVSAIKKLQFIGLGTSELLLSEPALAEYYKVRNAAGAKCRKVWNAAWAEYYKVRNAAEAECDKVRNAAEAEYDKVRNAAEAEYDKVRNAAWAEYDKVRNAAWAECDKVWNAAEAEYDKVRNAAFWKLFKSRKNRNPAWR